MNRKIKFRAWDKEKKEMFVVGAMTFLYEKLEIAVDDEDWVLREQSILMQYTGLKDKNGKEIYEGDVIKWENIYDHVMEISAIKNIKHFWEIYFQNSYGDPDFDIDKCEVIGDIYQNKELLKKITD